MPYAILSSRTVLGTVIRLIIYCSYDWCLQRHQCEQSIEDLIGIALYDFTIAHGGDTNSVSYFSSLCTYDFLGNNSRNLLAQIVLFPDEHFVFAKYGVSAWYVLSLFLLREKHISLTRILINFFYNHDTFDLSLLLKDTNYIYKI